MRVVHLNCMSFVFVAMFFDSMQTEIISSGIIDKDDLELKSLVRSPTKKS